VWIVVVMDMTNILLCKPVIEPKELGFPSQNSADSAKVSKNLENGEILKKTNCL
jgi:hypothetical protein